MHDQADELRRLARLRAAAGPHPPIEGPRKIVVSAGKGGVGTTTLAVNLAVALGRQGCRTILVDADLNGADATWLCGIESRDTIADVFSGRRSVHEVLQPGPAGIQVAPGIWSPGAVPDCSAAAQDRLLHELGQLGRHADWIVLDAGSGLNHVVRRFWQAADRTLLVTTPDAVAVMDAYAGVKTFLTADTQPPVQTIVNQAAAAEVTESVHARLATAAQRFLGLKITAAGSLPWDPAVALAAAAGQPLIREHATAPVAQAIDRLAEQLLAEAASDSKTNATNRRSKAEIVAA